METDLDIAIAEIRAMPADRRARVVATIAELIAQVQKDSEFDSLMRASPDVSDRVQDALDAAEADRLSGRFEPLETIMIRLRKKITEGDG